MVGIPLLTLECASRLSGFRPTVPSSPETWLHAYEQIRPETVVLIGASRIQAGVDPQVLQRELQRDVVQLALPGQSPLPMLHHLAEETEYKGLLIVDYIPRVLFQKRNQGNLWVQGWIDQIETFVASPARRLEAWLQIQLQAELTLLQPALSPATMVGSLLQGRFPKPPYFSLREDRYRRLDFERVDTMKRARALYEARTDSTPVGERKRVEIVGRIDAWADQIASRGGRVVLLRMPSAGLLGKLESERYPQSRYWDPVTRLNSVSAVHYTDHPSLSRFECPDGSHLDVRDARRFTRALAGLLKESGLDNGMGPCTKDQTKRCVR